MSRSPAVCYALGVPERLRPEAARLYDQAFGAKLALAVPEPAARLRLIAATLPPDFALVALHGDALVGLAGFHTPEGSLTGGLTARGLFQHLGLWGGLRALAVLALYARPTTRGEMVMDGIVVDASMRG